MDDFTVLDISCTHCGKLLEARPAPVMSGVSIHGLRNLLYRHADGTTECVVTKTFRPEPYDCWTGSGSFERMIQMESGE